MLEDDVYPNDGTFFQPTIEPEDQVKERRETKSKVAGAKPLIREILTHFDERIAATDSVRKTLELAQTYGISREQALVVCDVVRQQLEAEKGWLDALLED